MDTNPYIAQHLANTEVYELDNGFEVAIVRHPSPICLGALKVNFGAIDERPDEFGYAHLLEHVVHNSPSKKYSVSELKGLREALGASSYNARTNPYHTMYFAEFLSSDLDSFLEAVSQMAGEPVLTQSALDKERPAVIEEMYGYFNEPNYFDHVKFLEKLYGQNKPESYQTLGNEESIARASLSGLQSFMERGYTAQNMRLTLVGDVPETHSLVERLFGHLSSGEKRELVIAPRPTIVGSHFLYGEGPELYNAQQPERSGAQALVAFNSPSSYHPDNAALRALSIILSSGETSRLYKRVREQEGLVYGIDCSFSRKNHVNDDLSLYASMQAPNVQRVLEASFDEFAKIKDSGVTLPELERAKREVKFAVLKSLPDLSNIAQEINRKIDFNSTELDYVAALEAVTLDDIQRVAQKYLPSDFDGPFIGLVRSPLIEIPQDQ